MKQLHAKWTKDRKFVRIISDGKVLVKHPVEYSARSKSWMKPKGNGKTQFGNIGVIGGLRNGCFRALTQCGRCDQRCYFDEGKKNSGCYADSSLHAMMRRHAGFSVIHNGYKKGTEGFFHIHCPKDGNHSLSQYQAKYWRVDSESGTSCMSLALGLTQTWAEANPDKFFIGISSNYFYVSDDKLAWAKDLGNIVIGHTLSPWFAMDDLRNRVKAIRRFQKAGVPTVIWLATRPDWKENNPEEDKYIRKVLKEFDARQIIEVPYHTSGTGHYAHTESINPWGACCEVGVDETGEFSKEGEPHKGYWRGVCYGCKVYCGCRWLFAIRRGEVSQ